MIKCSFAKLFARLAVLSLAMGGQNYLLSQEMPLLERYPSRILARRELLAQRITPEGTEEGVIESGRTWRPGSQVTVAFKGGSKELHKRIADTASEWTKHANLSFDFGAQSGGTGFRTWSRGDQRFVADIRISFDEEGYWSLLGTESSDPDITLAGEASMNFENFDVRLPEGWEGTVLHEFGHAIGFHHEHQNPIRPCDFRWENDPGYVVTRDEFGQFKNDDKGRRPGLYTMLGGPPNEWSRSEVDFNLKALPGSRAYLLTPFDRDSIMKYDLPESMFAGGNSSHCFTGRRNNSLSEGDKKIVSDAYPKEETAIEEVNSRRAKFERLRSNGPKTSEENPMPADAGGSDSATSHRKMKGAEFDRYLNRLLAIRPRTSQFKEGSSARMEVKPLQPRAQVVESRLDLERVVDDPDFLPANFVVRICKKQGTRRV